MPPKEESAPSPTAPSTEAALNWREPWHKSASLAVGFISLAAVQSQNSQYNLSPVYGSISAGLYHNYVIAVGLVLAIALKSTLRRLLQFEARNFVPLVALWIPVSQWFLFELSGNLGPRYGPVITELLTYVPMLFFSTLASLYAFDELQLFGAGQDPDSSVIQTGVPTIGVLAIYGLVQRTASRVLPLYLGTNDFFTRSGLQMVVASMCALMSRSQLLLFAVPAMLHTMFANPHYYSWSATTKLNGTLSQYDCMLLARRDGVTGYISVLENEKERFRLLRCDHSLLGGEWLLTPEREAQGQKSKETIYSVFTMLESVRLVESASSKADSEKRALFIGLGIGTSPAAFIKHGIDTTIVELDPVVHEFAIRYFDLPTNHTAVISDAVPFIAKVAETQPESYDYIVHDVFTGGAEPTALFTFEFLDGLNKLIKKDGVVAINYAGDLTLPPPRLVLNTISAVFPTCRIFRDTLPEESSTTFLNMVVFCTKQADTPLTFRKPVDADFLGSLSRQNLIPPTPDLEIKIEDVRVEEKLKSEVEGVVLRKGEEWRIEKYHPEAARRHWHVMRMVVKDEIWENW